MELATNPKKQTSDMPLRFKLDLPILRVPSLPLATHLQISSPLLIDAEKGYWFAEPLQEKAETPTPTPVVKPPPIPFPLDIDGSGGVVTRIRLPRNSLICIRGARTPSHQASSYRFPTRRRNVVVDVSPMQRTILWISERGKPFAVGGGGDFLLAYCSRGSPINVELVEGSSGLYLRVLRDLSPGQRLIVR